MDKSSLGGNHWVITLMQIKYFLPPTLQRLCEFTMRVSLAALAKGSTFLLKEGSLSFNLVFCAYRTTKQSKNYWQNTLMLCSILVVFKESMFYLKISIQLKA